MVLSLEYVSNAESYLPSFYHLHESQCQMQYYVKASTDRQLCDGGVCYNLFLY